jgi:hypothetical protein
MRKPAATLFVMMALLASFSARGNDEPAQKSREQPKQASIWMKEKLFASQNILAGMTKGDFDIIGKNANSMLIVEYLEKWFRADIPGYRAQLTDFEHANQALVVAARQKNLDAATVAYLQLTISCVNCHKLVRDVPK